MLDLSTEKLPTQEELDLWQFDLAKRIVKNGRSTFEKLDLLDNDSIEEMRKKYGDRQAEIVRELSVVSED